MPRTARRDAAGCIHHVMLRGLERRAIFLDDSDRLDLLERLDRVLPDERVDCLAWALMDNHVHLVLRTGPRPLHHAIARIATGYAAHFNRRHDRVGYVTQGRFKSRPVSDAHELRVVVRYVHQNPLRAGQVADVASLVAWPWSGHGALLGLAPPHGFHSVERAIELLGGEGASQPALRRFLCATIDDGDASAPSEARSVDDALREAEIRFGVSAESLRSRDRARNLARAREWVVRRLLGLGLGHEAVAAALGVSRGWVSLVARERGAGGEGVSLSNPRPLTPRGRSGRGR